MDSNFSWPSYEDLLEIKTKENNEPIIELSKTIKGGYHKSRSFLKKILTEKIFIRKSVNEKLIKVNQKLKEYDENYSLYIFEGYRPYYIQEKRFIEMLSKISKNEFFKNPKDLYNEVHERVAVPNVAGHPTGGAVDVGIYNLKTKKIEDFGSKFYDYSNNNHRISYKTLTNKQLLNRMTLRQAMIESRFAPFNGEYWHFSYGDKEWAKYYNKKEAIYGIKEINTIIKK